MTETARPAQTTWGDFAGAAASQVSAAAINGNSAEAEAYGAELRAIVREAAENAPRSLQRHLGPSEVGAACDRRVVHRLAGLPNVNRLSDPWPSIMGTAGHAWMEQTFNAAEPGRWLVERRVIPHPDHAGTSDLYDVRTFTVNDHKFLGTTSHKDLVRHGPSRTYLVQLLLYALGYMLAGYRVDRIAILAWPRTGSELSGLYVWMSPITPEHAQLLEYVLTAELPHRKALSAQVETGRLSIFDVEMTPDPKGCWHCPLYSPAGARTGHGCEGPSTPR